MPATLPVHLNRESVHSLEVADAFETEGSFTVALINHGEATHVHVHLDDALSAVATIDANNHYVEAGARRPVRVEVTERGTVYGKLKVATGYGAETRYVDVDLVEPGDPGRNGVAVDESLAEPPAEDVPEGMADLLSDRVTEWLADRVTLPVAALVGISVAMAVAAVTVVDSLAVTIGALVVLGGALVASALALADRGSGPGPHSPGDRPRR